ncbi:MAG: site-specific integrase [Candidatus Scalindua sp.]|nr:site-specific integrase [Candidatus Scalindua sp.]
MQAVKRKLNFFENTDLIGYLLQQNEGDVIMIGRIRALGKCPVCQCLFQEFPRIGFICAEHKTIPKRFLIDFYQGKRIRLYSDNQGRSLCTYQRALELLNRINQEIKDHIFDASNYVKSDLQEFYVTNLLDKFLEHKLTKVAPSYISHYKRYVKIAKKYFKTKDSRDLRKLDLINYGDHVKAKYKFSDKTLKNCLDLFKVFLNYLKNDLEIIQTVPAFPQIYTDSQSTRWLTQAAQITAFNNVADEDQPIIAFLMLSGCRPGEARALKCKDVDLERQFITISATFSKSVYRQRRKGQGSKSFVIPIHPEIFDYIKARVENNLPEAFVFTHGKGLHYSKSKINRVWNLARDKAGLDKSIRLYDATRHSFASQLANIGISSEKVSRLLGHSSTKMTQRYIHHDIDKLKIDVNSISLKTKKVEKFPSKENVDNS